MAADEAEALREFCDGIDEAQTDRVVAAFGTLDGLRAVFALDPAVTEETLRAGPKSNFSVPF